MITVLGSINMDLVASVGRLPRPGETVPGKSFTTTAGGKGANQALAARRAESATRLVGAVGDDAFASNALSMLRAASVDLTGVKVEPTITGTAMILVDESGQNMIAVTSGANASVDTEMASSAVGAMACDDILMLQMEISEETILTALQEGRQKGLTTILNVAPFTAQSARLAALADIVVANETEFELLYGVTVENHHKRIEALKELHSQAGRTFVVTLGADCVIAIRHGQIYSAMGLTIEPVDTVGAGDTFCGYLAAGLDQGNDFSVALRRAAVAGSLACLEQGAQVAIPLASVVEERI
ncbi:ribokinase [Rhizobium sp. LjRoot258]|jgi:ribokinase|uniref:ribokinase n=1 Tax=Rhizobium sp. LjRoot258 TaxID=3342299 RepID=UPI003ECF2EBF